MMVVDVATGKEVGNYPVMEAMQAMTNQSPQRATDDPTPGSAAELADFQRLQARLPVIFRDVFPDPQAPRTVVILPSLSLDAEVLAKITGAHHYEERMLCLLLLLRLPRTRVIYLTSQPIPDSIIDYYLHLLPGIPTRHARDRLTLLACHDAAPLPLAAKILARPRLVERIRAAVGDPATAHMSCFNVSALERSLAVRLDVPIYGCDPALLPLGSKSGGRRLLRAAGVPVPDGAEDLKDAQQLAEALAELKRRHPAMERAVVKLNEGFSGEGNATFTFAGAPLDRGLSKWVCGRLPQLAFEAKSMGWEIYETKVTQMGAVAEAFVEGAEKRSPSAQYRVDPLGRVEVISTHDQVLGGRSGRCRVDGAARRLVFVDARRSAEPEHAVAAFVNEANIPLGVREALVGRFSVAAPRLGIILCDAVAAMVHQADIALGGGIALMCCFAIPVAIANSMTQRIRRRQGRRDRRSAIC